ncbi:MAG: hypothetical protein IPK13_02660 [Deltaproteobacteria bacterium]|nr:hypothetical protein [Deltaproteobacteria bacterium]
MRSTRRSSASKSSLSAPIVLSALALAFGLGLGSASVAKAQAWPRDQGHGYLQLSLTHLAGDRLYGSDFAVLPIASTYAQTLLSFYGEIGLIDRWLTAVVDAELFRRNVLEGQGSTQGLGDLKVGLFSGIVQEGAFRLSVGAVLGVPTGDDAPTPGESSSTGTNGNGNGNGNGDIEGPSVDADARLIARSLPTGDGEFDLRFVVATGYALAPREGWPVHHYVSGSVGYWTRTRGFSDAMTYDLEIGSRIDTTFLERVWWVARLQGVESFASAADAQAGFAGLGDGVTYTSLGFKASLRVVDGVAASVGVDTAIRARSIIAAVPIRAGIAYDW